MTEKYITSKKKSFDTVALHAGQQPDPLNGARAVPLYQTSSYVFESTEKAAALFQMQEPGYIYSRNGNPTNAVLEERLTELEGGIGGFAVSSGQAAISVALLTLAKSGDEIITTNALYGGTYNLFAETFKGFGVTVRFVNGHDSDEVEQAINEKTKAIFTESIGNPNAEIADLHSLSAIAKRHRVPLVVDNTFTTPYLQKPIDFGADIVVFSTTKFIGGHGTSIGGAIVDAGTFNWENERFPDFNRDKPSIGNTSFNKLAGKRAFITKARFELGHDLGTSLSPFNSWLFIQGLETLSFRMKQHVENAKKTAVYLRLHPDVEWVNYPGTPGDPQYELAKTYLPRGVSSIFTFGIKGGRESAERFIDSLSLISHLANVGDSKTLAIHPASTTHARMTAEQQLQAGVYPDQIRLSIGLEDIDDILADLDQSLCKAKRGGDNHEGSSSH
ncbi:O-acetylhomoserine aminocarboxypropyltransferase/cysteine synthase family protein [Terribacillus halophilus]|uniref:O-acetylhomoserine aminocarboxypropyltransferase/cysteine synthase family protein n=1 Tax=Terribacillus halophilus TaxID=361279 RepID=UPI000985CE97|nr:O-acetylhomoserine aminocarboxypropyltransferase/cysteine synthase family protein [Terribacillus halophilus]